MLKKLAVFLSALCLCALVLGVVNPPVRPFDNPYPEVTVNEG